MLANLYLHEFDDWVVNKLGKEIDLKYVRYADDFIILVKNPDLLEKIDQKVAQKLESKVFSLKINKKKTKPIDVRKDGLDFVGFNFDERQMRIRQKTIDRFKNRITEEIFLAIPDHIKKQKSPKKTLRWLAWRINSKIQGLRGKEICPWCGFERIGAPRSWMAFFHVATDIDQLRELDKWIRKMLYDHIYNEFRLRIDRSQLKKLLKKSGLKSLVNEKYQVRGSKTQPCLCDIRKQNQDIWIYASGLYQGKSFETLVQKRPFTIPYVD
jgi:hypothetical protein